MNRKDLYNSFNVIDDEILERSETTRKREQRTIWLKWCTVAAILCLMTAITLPQLLHGGRKETAGENGFPEDPISSAMTQEGSTQPSTDQDPLSGEAPNGTFSASYGNTSDTYATLPELLAYLSNHDAHNEERTDAIGSSTTSPSKGQSNQPENINFIENTGVAVTASGDYCYHIGESQVAISHLDGENTKNVGNIPLSADALFLCNDSLLTVSRYQSGGDELNQEMSVRVGIYDIAVPENPTLLDEYVQLGDLTACWMSGADLYLVTSDGICACGWSRLDDPEDYYPALSHNGSTVEWDDSDISILGKPTSVQYSAITVINGNSREVVRKEALYGNIKNLFYGADWIAAVAAGETATFRENPVTYTFDRELHFTGKINAAQILNVPVANALKDYLPQDGTYLDIVSVTKQDNAYRMLGTYSTRDGGNTSSYFVAIAADPKTGVSGSELLPTDSYPHAMFTEILWEENRAIACVGILKNVLPTEIEQETRFLFAEFHDLTITFHESDLTADYLNSRVGVGYGNPLGEFQTLIPMGNGIYVRYTALPEGPGGFAVFDFSDSSAPSCLYSAEASLSGKDAFDYIWHVYDETTFGTLKVLLGTDESFRNVGLSWCVYQIREDKRKVSLQKEYLLDDKIKTYFGADALGYTVFIAKDKLYYATKEKPSVGFICY